MKTNDLPSLPPAEFLTTVIEEIPADLVARALTEALSATTTTRAGLVEPDTRSRLAAAQMILDRVLGKPIERQQVVTANVKATDDDLIERLAHSPALRAAIREAVEAAERSQTSV